MVRINEIIRKFRGSNRGSVAFKASSRKKRDEVKEKLEKMMNQIEEKIKNGELFEAAMIASQMTLIAETENVFPPTINWSRIYSLAGILERSRGIERR